MMNHEFILRPYSKSQLAMLYFPEAHSSHVAVNRLMGWIERNKVLMDNLYACGYEKRMRNLSRRMVALIVEYLGEP